jgi:EAL domain-containing protein (putative c-di-GMP-specific phosphodiesterase class I)
VNLSARQLRDESFPVRIEQILRDFSISPTSLELEITESAAMENAHQTVTLLKRLRAMGIELSIDDFGTGYSSLNYLKLFPIQRLKLDHSFVRDMEDDSNDAAICSATISLAHSLGLGLLAEGVETAAQYKVLRRMGCDLAQGYYFSRPVPANEVLQFFTPRR